MAERNNEQVTLHPWHFFFLLSESNFIRHELGKPAATFLGVLSVKYIKISYFVLFWVKVEVYWNFQNLKPKGDPDSKQLSLL